MDPLKVIRTIRNSAHDRLKLICFSHAGGNGSEYFAWRDFLAPDIELAVVNLKGRGARFNEACATEMSEIVAEVVDSLIQITDLPFAFFGHSMGSLLAYECTHALRKHSDALTPKMLCLSGRKAPHLPLNRRKLYDLSDQQFLDEVRKFGSASSDFFVHQDLMALALPIMRADFKVHDDYQFVGKDKLNIPFLLFGGKSDSTTSETELGSWREHTQASCQLFMFDGGHFYTEDNAQNIVETLNNALMNETTLA